MKAKIIKCVKAFLGSILIKIESYWSLCILIFGGKTMNELHLSTLDIIGTILISIFFVVVFYKYFELKNKITIQEIVFKIRTYLIIKNYHKISDEVGIFGKGEKSIISEEKNEVKQKLMDIMPQKGINEINKIIDNFYSDEHNRKNK